MKILWVILGIAIMICVSATMGLHQTKAANDQASSGELQMNVDILRKAAQDQCFLNLACPAELTGIHLPDGVTYSYAPTGMDSFTVTVSSSEGSLTAVGQV